MGKKRYRGKSGGGPNGRPRRRRRGNVNRRPEAVDVEVNENGEVTVEDITAVRFVPFTRETEKE